MGLDVKASERRRARMGVSLGKEEYVTDFMNALTGGPEP